MERIVCIMQTRDAQQKEANPVLRELIYSLINRVIQNLAVGCGKTIRWYRSYT